MQTNKIAKKIFVRLGALQLSPTTFKLITHPNGKPNSQQYIKVHYSTLTLVPS